MVTTRISDTIKVREPEIIIFDDSSFPGMLKKLELAGRVCYKSEDKIKPGTAYSLIRRIIDRGHESVLEHCSISVQIVCDRGVTHEIVRQRLCSFSQESTRYCDYNGRPIEVISPWWTDQEQGSEKYRVWLDGVSHAAGAYKQMRAAGASPQEARAVLPNSLKTEIVVTANIREWRHIFSLRCAKDAHPDFRRLMVPLVHTLNDRVPVVFEGIASRFPIEPWMSCTVATQHIGE